METGRAAPLKEPFHSREDLVLFTCLTLTGLSLYLLEIFSGATLRFYSCRQASHSITVFSSLPIDLKSLLLLSVSNSNWEVT